ncbi:MAG: hypothetical protein ACLRZQ_04475 [Akkermansia muciniphila]
MMELTGGSPASSVFALCPCWLTETIRSAGPYATMVRRCVDYILSRQNKVSGYIGDSMYNHGFATLALAEAYGMVRDDRIGPALRKAVTLTLTAQKKTKREAGAIPRNPRTRTAR